MADSMLKGRTLILGTAGHVDHGKTALVRALTGIDTDRLEEEHRRGISIELGFAELTLDDDTRVGIVDVPGHERFVRQMVAGAGGMDMAMLLVAADEGLMPQTHEHLDVLELLGVACGIIVITKLDLADPDLLEVIEEEVAERVAGGFLASAPVVRVSSKTGEGIDELRRVILERAQNSDARVRGGDFRLPIDRVFSMAGAGVVVTGSAWSGSVRTTDTLHVMPSGRDVRVRELQSHGAPAEEAFAGERVALALHGVKRDEILRGDQLVSGRSWHASKILGVNVTALPALGSGRIKQRARFHVHHAAREVLGRLDLLQVDGLAAGESSLARLHLEEELIAAPGDRIVLRSYSPMFTVAGAVVLDPVAPGRQRRAESLPQLEAFAAAGVSGWPLQALRMAGANGLAANELVARMGVIGVDADVARAQIQVWITDRQIIQLGERCFDVAAIGAVGELVLKLCRAHQVKKPLDAGLSKEELRQACAVSTPQLFSAQLEHLAKAMPIFTTSDRVRADAASPQLDAAQGRDLSELEETIRAAKPAYKPSREDMRDPRVALLLSSGKIVRLEGPLLAHHEHLDAFAAAARDHFASHESMEIGDAKRWTGASRKFVVPMLEWLDGEGISHFDGQHRVAGKNC